jgi:hypothetical protein
MVRLRYCRMQNLKLNITHKSCEMAYNCKLMLTELHSGQMPHKMYKTAWTESYVINPHTEENITDQLMYFVGNYG